MVSLYVLFSVGPNIILYSYHVLTHIQHGYFTEQEQYVSGR